MSRFDRSSNPAMRAEYFERAHSGAGAVMTVQGAINKIAILLVLVFSAASFTWKMTLEYNSAAGGLMMAGMIGGLIMAIITIMAPAKARFTAPIYAVFEGLLLGSLSAMVKIAAGTGPDGLLAESIVMMAILLTFMTLGGMLFLYKTGIVKVTEKFKAGVLSATAGVFFAYLFSMILGWMGFMSPLHTGGLLGIGLSLIIVGIAAFNLILDFDMIFKGAENNAPEHFEWYAAFGLMVTLIWLYIEILRLLLILQRRD
ncbi:MAG: hypothetical protein GQF41_3981 [Candidatus Rifleibacterium amylolyticum]|nr:MAG: hypothetical protein GQF41_3981 [Candidatus Rifleibacterium amylolyticum]NLF97511.1 Bax inhibitor-1/YccA family protein [Candidatus Riflebacteria bacterium]